MFKVNIKDTVTTSMMFSDIFNVNIEHISHLFLVFLLLTYSRPEPLNFIQKNPGTGVFL